MLHDAKDGMKILARSSDEKKLISIFEAICKVQNQTENLDLRKLSQDLVINNRRKKL